MAVTVVDTAAVARGGRVRGRDGFGVSLRGQTRARRRGRIPPRGEKVAWHRYPHRRDARAGRRAFGTRATVGANGRAAGWVRTEGETRGGGGVGPGRVAALAAARERARLARRKQTLEPERRREEIFPVAPETRRRRAPGGRVGARTAPLLHGSVHARGHGRARREGEGDGRHLRCSAGVLQRMRTRWRGRALLRDARRPHFANGAQRSTDRLVDRSARSFYRKPLTGGPGKSRRRENLFFLAPLLR